jgi:hypothetical protein
MTAKEYDAAVQSAAHPLNTAAVCAAKNDPVALAALKATMTAEQYDAAVQSAATIDKLGSNVAAVCAAKGNDDALAALKATMTAKEYDAAVQSAATIDKLGSNVAAVCAAKNDPVALAALKATMTAEQFAAAAKAAAAIDKLGSEQRARAVDGNGRILVTLTGPSNASIIFPTTLEANSNVHFIELKRPEVRHLTGRDVWKEPAKPNKPAPGHSRCADCMKEYKQGNTKSHKKNCQPSKAEVVWADRDCALESRVRIRLSGSVIRTSAGVEWKPSSNHSAIMAKNGIVIQSVTQNAEVIDT